MAEGARLESVFRGNSNVGSNPTLSAISASHIYVFPATRHNFASERHLISVEILLTAIEPQSNLTIR